MWDPAATRLAHDREPCAERTDRGGDLDRNQGTAPGPLLAGRYALGHALGDAGPGATRYAAQDTVLERPVEVLLLDPALPTTEEALDAARRASLVDDHRLRRIYEVASDGGTAFVVGEPAGGTTLADYAGRGPVEPEQARAIIGEAAAALEAARRHGVRHLALDARSVRVTDDGEVMVTGTGIANALGANLVLTPARASRKDAGDLVELLYLALTGRAAGNKDGAPPPPPSAVAERIPHDLDDLCVRTLDEGIGPSSAGDLFHTLAPWGDIEPPPRTGRRTGTPQGAPPPPPPAPGPGDAGAGAGAGDAPSGPGTAGDGTTSDGAVAAPAAAPGRRATPRRGRRATREAGPRGGAPAGPVLAAGAGVVAGAGAAAGAAAAGGAAGPAGTGAPGIRPAGPSTPSASSAPPPPLSDETEEISAVRDEPATPTAQAGQGDGQRPSTLGGRLRRRPVPPTIPPTDAGADSSAPTGAGTDASAPTSSDDAATSSSAPATTTSGAAGPDPSSAPPSDTAPSGTPASDTPASDAPASDTAPSGAAAAAGAVAAGAAGGAAAMAAGAGRPAGAGGPHEAGHPDGGGPTHPGDRTPGPGHAPDHQDAPAEDPLAHVLPNQTSARLDALRRRVVGGARPPVRRARVAPAHLPLPDPDAPAAPSAGGTGAAAGAGVAAGAGRGPDAGRGTGAGAGTTAGEGADAGTTAGDAAGTGATAGRTAGAGAGSGAGAGAGSGAGAKVSAAAAAAAAGIGSAGSSISRSARRARSSIGERLGNPGRLSEEEAAEQPLDVPYAAQDAGGTAGGAASSSDRGRTTGATAAYRPTGSLEEDRGPLMDDRVPGREVGPGTVDPMPWVVVLFTILLLLGGWWAASTLFTPTTAVELPSESPPPPAAAPDDTEETTTAAPADDELPAPTLDRTELVDPEGGGTDNADTAPLAADGDVDTYWRTLSYQAPDFGVKSGTGLLVWLTEISAVSGITLDTFADGAGGHVEIRVSDPATPGEGELLAEGPFEEGPTEFTWEEPVSTAHLIVWITELPTAGSDGANRAEIAEITVQ